MSWAEAPWPLRSSGRPCSAEPACQTLFQLKLRGSAAAPVGVSASREGGQSSPTAPPSLSSSPAASPPRCAAPDRLLPPPSSGFLSDSSLFCCCCGGFFFFRFLNGVVPTGFGDWRGKESLAARWSRRGDPAPRSEQDAQPLRLLRVQSKQR